LIKLFKNADEKSSWVRVPVINYLRSCPLPEAKSYIDELAKVDPDAVKRAQTFFPFNETQPAGPSQPSEEKASAPKATDSTSVSEVQNDVALAQPQPPEDQSEGPTPPVIDSNSSDQDSSADELARSVESLEPVLAAGEPEQEVRGHSLTSLPVKMPARPAAAPVAAATPLPNLFVVWGVPVVCGTVLFLVLRLILGTRSLGQAKT
jgi:hypothetical protein